MTSDPVVRNGDASAGAMPDLPGTGDGSQRLHPLSIITTGLRYLRGLILPVIVVMISRGFSGDRVENTVTFGIPLAAALLSVIGGAFHWAFSRYELNGRELEVKTGFISRQQRVVPVERIQAVDFEEAPLERVLGLVRVRVETAASGHEQARIELNALGRKDADLLRGKLLTLRAGMGEAGSPSPVGEATPPGVDLTEGEVLYRLSVRDLLLAGATSGRIGPAAAVVGVLMQFGTDLVPRSWWERVPWDSAAHAGVQAIIAAVIVLGLLAWMLAIGTTVLTFAGFELRAYGRGQNHANGHSHNHNRQLVIRHGLLDRRRRTIPLRRIQAVVTIETVIRQPFGFAEIRIESAGQVGGEEDASGVLVPFIRMADVPALIAAATPEFSVPDDPSALERLPKRAARRYVVPPVLWTAALCLAVNVVFWRWVNGLHWWTLAAAVLVPLAALQGWMEYRAAGWGLTAAHLVLRWRTLTGRHVLVTRRQRLQHRGTTANIFQRRARLATFHAAVASGSSGGHFALPHLEARDADWLLAELQPARTREALRGAAAEP